MKTSFIAILVGSIFYGTALMADVALPPIEVVEIPTPAAARDQEVRREAQRMLKERDFVGLDALAAQLRNGQERLDGGTWILSNFYRTLADLPDDEPAADGHLASLRAWAAEQPASITARVALANGLVSYAWRARGGGWASTVSEEGWRLMDERLDEAWEVLQQAKELPIKCPGWYSAAQAVALGQGWDRDDYMDMVHEAIQLEPTYGRYYTSACYWLLPRWHGSEGDFEAWLAKIAASKPPDEKARHYAFLVWMADRMEFPEEMVFGPDRLDWDLTRAGFDQWLEEKPDNLMVAFQYLYLALRANDAGTARRLLDRIGGKYYPRMWESEAEFEAARQFAYAGGPNPLIQTAKPKPIVRLKPGALEWLTVGFRMTAGFLGGLIVGGCLLGICLQRRLIWPGVIVMISSVLVATIFGTIATLLPTGILFLYLRRLGLNHPPKPSLPSGWWALLWVVVLLAANLGLQTLASLWASIVPFLELGIAAEAEVIDRLATDGTILTIAFNSMLVMFLGLVLVCGPLNPDDWRRRLALHSVKFPSALIWSAVALGVALGTGFLMEFVMDAHSREVLELMSRGINSPVSYYLAIALAAPVAEELLIRGYAYSAWIDKLGFWKTATATSLIFAISHVQYGWSGLAFVLIFGFLLAGLRWKTKSVYPCVAVHVLNNLTHCLMLQFLPS